MRSIHDLTLRTYGGLIVNAKSPQISPSSANICCVFDGSVRLLKYSSLTPTREIQVLKRSLLFAGFLTLYGCSTAAPPPSGNLAQNKAALDTWFAVLNGRNVDALDSVIAPDFNRIASAGQSLTGVDAMKKFATGLRTAYPDLHIVLDDALWANDTVYTMWTVTGTNTGPGQIPPTGKSIKVSGEARGLYKNGKAIEERAFFDGADFYGQLGYTITPPAAAAPAKKM